MAPRCKPSRRLQALVDEYAQGQSCLSLLQSRITASTHTIRPSVLSELKLQFSGNDQDILSALGDICHSDAPDEESFTRVANFYNMDREILEAEQKMYSSFCRARGFIANAVSEVLQTIHENDFVVMLPEFATVVHILAVIPATSCSAERSFNALRRLKTYLRSTMGQQRVSNIALIHIERAHANLY